MSESNSRRTAWRFGSRWDELGRAGTSIAMSVFMKHNVVFAMDSACMKMKEGDLLAISDGYEIMAIGKALTPPACITKFDIAYEPGEEEFFTDDRIYGCRAQIIPLDEEDVFTYKKAGRFYHADQPEDKINELWKKYSDVGAFYEARGSSQPNIFHWATKELSQDAFLCWLLQWASSEYARDNANMHILGKAFVEDLLSDKIPGWKLPAGSHVSIYRQRAYVDVVVNINTTAGERYVIMIEDKKDADVYNDLHAYLSSLQEDECFRDCLRDHFFPVLFKTGEQSMYEIRKKVEGVGCRLYMRDDMLRFFASQHQYVTHPLVRDFLAYIQNIEEEVSSFRHKPFSEWTESSWRGFYSFLGEKTPFKTWFYVNNARGGFLSSETEFHWDIHDLFPDCECIYWQIDNRRKQLCLKIGGVYDNHEQVRNQVIEMVDKYLAKYQITDIVSPARVRKGCYMTIKVVELEHWLGTLDGVIDTEWVTERLGRYEDILTGILADAQ